MDGAGSSTNFPISQTILFAALKLIFFLELKIAEPSKKGISFLKNSKFRRNSTFYDARGAKATHLSATLRKQKR